MAGHGLIGCWRDVFAVSTVINEKTKVPLIMAVGLVVGCLGFIVAGVWWAATMQTKLDSIILQVATSQVQVTTALEKFQGSNSELDKRVLLLEQQYRQLLAAVGRRDAKPN